MSSKRYKVILVDDQTLIRAGIRSLLELEERIQVVGEASSAEGIVDEVERLKPDVVLMDIRMPRASGIDGVTQLSASGIKTPVIMLTTFDDHELVSQAVKGGARGYLLKDVSLETLTDAIEQVCSGKTLIQPAFTQEVIKGIERLETDFDSAAMPELLSDKEKEILRLIGTGYSNREMAQMMFKSEGTVKNQVSAVLAKLGVRDRTRAVLKALNAKLI